MQVFPLIPSLLVLALALAIGQRVLGQDDLRVASDKVEGSGHPRAVQRHLSPHRMMHFGKRPALVAPPTLFLVPTPVADLGSAAKRRRAAEVSVAPDSRVWLEFEDGTRLWSLPAANEDPMPLALDTGLGRSRAPLAELLGVPSQARSEEQLLNQIDTNDISFPFGLTSDDDGARLARLTSGENEISTSQNGERPQANALGQDQASNGRTRPMQPSALSDGQVHDLLFGSTRPRTMIRGFNKKAEPTSNLFMHFGRK